MASNQNKTTETDESYDRLYQAIVQGELRPNERLVELELAKRFDVGRSAIRTALFQLEQEGLVEREPNRGARVRLVTEEEAVEMYEVRAVLEGLAARYAAQKISEQEAEALRAIHQEMQACFGRGDLLKISDLNAELHRKILDIAQHETVTRLLERLKAQHVRYQYRTILISGRAQQSLTEHQAIIEALTGRDEEAAEAAMRHHVANVVEAMRQSFNQSIHI